MASIGFI